MSEQKWEPKIVAFVCNWCTYTGADLAGTSRLKYPTNVKLIRVMCSGGIDPVFILKAFERGADGILVSGCHPNDCHYNAGNFHARRRWEFFDSLLKFLGIEEGRLQFSWVSASEGKKFVDDVMKKNDKAKKDMENTIRKGIADYMSSADIASKKEVESLKQEIKKLKKAPKTKK